MDWTDIGLGFLQGATEFLPVSSSGHLFLLESFLNTGSSSLYFVLLLHSATLFSIFVVFFKDLKVFILKWPSKSHRQLLFKVLLSLMPLFLVGLFLRSFVEQSFEKSTVAWGFFSSGCILFSLFFVRKRNRTLQEINYFQALLIGTAQAFAVLPGFSRSAWTIATGLYCGLSGRSAVYFSFLISIPAIAGSALMALVLNLKTPPESAVAGWTSVMSFSLAFLSAFLSGLLSLLLVLKMTQERKLPFFAFYLLPLSLIVYLFL